VRKELSSVREELDRVRAEAEARLEREVAAARATTETKARQALRTREEELIRERATIEGKLAATRRQLDEPHEGAVVAEPRASEVEIEPAAAPEHEDQELAPPAWVMAEATEATEPTVEEAEAAVEPEPEPEAEPEPEPSDPERTPHRTREPAAEEEQQPAPEGMLSLSSASFEDLREIGMSVTQAKRVIRRREEQGAFTNLEELDQVPGFPKSFLADVKDRLVP
jgi:DNA uptake protein ComE-like DNA-binding protein